MKERENNPKEKSNVSGSDADVPNIGTNSSDETDKYLALEQPGVSYTKDTNPTSNSDTRAYNSNDDEGTWNEEGGNSRESDAFNQDDDILEDNLDLDEDQNQSISSDDDDFEELNERYTN
ncbi:MAG: hypothetical protein ACOVRN_06095 [Flavobacterium sp.]